MVSKLDKINLQGQLLTVNGNEPFLLNDPQTIWVVQSGAVALFAVTVENDVVEGTRRYLFNGEPEEVLLGTVPGQCQILAVPMGKTELWKIEPEYFRKLVADGDPCVATWVKGWLQKFNASFSPAAMPAVQVRSSGQGRFSLTDGQTFQPEADTVVWVRVQQGILRWQGLEDFLLSPSTGILPIGSAMWLEADGEVQLTSVTTNHLKDANTLLLGLSQLHRQFLESLKYAEQQELTEELQRLQARERFNHQVTVEAIGELASPLMPPETSFFVENTPLLAAAGAVGRALKVKIRPPASSEDLQRVKEPLAAIARDSRLRMRRVLLRDDWWQQDCGALVAYTQPGEQPVALLPVSTTRYELYDPIADNRISLNAAIAATIAPVAYMFYRSFPDRVLSAFEVIKFGLFGRFKDLVVIILTGIAGALLGMLTPQATAILIDHAIPDSDRGLLLQIGLGLLVAAIASALFRLTQGFSLLRVETTSDASTQAAMWDRLLNVPVSFYRQYATGDLLSRVTSVSQMRRQLGGTMLIKLITGLFALLNLALLLFYSIKLALIAVAAALIAIIVTAVSGLFLVRKVRPLLELQGDIFGQVVQLINGISKLRIAGAEERAFACWSKNYSRQIKLELSTQLIEDIVAVFNTVLPTITSGVLFWFTVKLLTEAQNTGEVGLTIGTFLAFNSAFKTFIGGAAEVSNTVTDVLQVTPQWKRAQPILATLPEVELTKADPGKLIGRITIDRVSFRYRPDAPLILENVSLYAEPGEFVALVGKSGSGKSTLFRLLLGFETPEDGRIYYDGQDLSGLDVSAMRRQLGVVLQNGNILSGSIFDNLAGSAQITLDEAWEAARMAGLAEDIEAMPMGMHTMVSEGGGNLSGGQRQRLLISRSLVLKPKILLFDEATSALDNRTQSIVSQSLDRLQATRLIIAHRLSTIQNADRIYVFDSGRVVQQGSFQQLAGREGLFARLMKRQMLKG
jgi:ATP-binding cassette subfamily C protein